MYILSTYLQTTANAGFRGARRDEDIQAGGPVSQPHVTDDAEGDDNPCTEDEEFFKGRPDADDMEEAITKFFGWNGGAGAQWLQGPAQISWPPSLAHCEGRSCNVALRGFYVHTWHIHCTY